MLPHVIATLLLSAHPGVHAVRVDARVACDTIHSPVVDGPGEVAMIAVGDNGRVAWTDALDGRKVASVLIRDARGTVRVVGKHGEGPGEFTTINTMSWRGDTLWVYDARLRRMQGFSASGKFLTAYPVRVGGVFSRTVTGSLMGWNHLPAPPSSKPVLLGPIGSMPLVLVRLGTATSAADTFYRYVPGPGSPNPTSLVQGSIPASSPDGSLWCITGPAATPGVQLRCLDANGKFTINGTRQFAPRPITDSVWESALKFYTRYSPRAEVDQMFHRSGMMPLVFAILVNRNGDIWVGRSHPSEPKQIWERMRQDGTTLPGITFNSRAQLRGLDGAWYYAVVTDDDDLQTLIRCAIP